jgi:peptidoglycan-associated lipoprotein
VLTVALLVPLGVACTGRSPDDDLGAGAAGAGLGEDALGGASSLERAKRGLGPEEDGTLADVRFGYDSFEIDSIGREALERNTKWLSENPRARVELEGHADARGTIEYNLALGAKRAKAVKDHLVVGGIAVERISTISYGEELPLCQEETETCWARNRRVHSVIVGQ